MEHTTRKTLTLTRRECTDTYTGGIIKDDGTHICYTLELPWKDNEPCVSCIPEGIYQCVWQRWRLPMRIEIQDVPERSLIQIHSGNYLGDTEGCILPGLERGNKYIVLRSGAAMDAIYAATGGQDFDLIVERE
jgi:hypothetical protein